MTIALACICGWRDDLSSPPSEPVLCPATGCGGRLYAIDGTTLAHTEKPWAVVAQATTPQQEGRQHV
jgi:hypothetical protein